MSNSNSLTTGNQQTTTFREVSIALPSKPSDQSPQSSPGSSSSPSSRPSLVAGGSPARLSGRHSVFRGIRLRNGKWVSEIREPRKTTRIWLGTYPVPEMAAAAYDVAALALKGSEAVLNFPDLALTYVTSASTSAADIRASAARAAEMKQPDPGGDKRVLDPGQPGKEEEASSSMSSPSAADIRAATARAVEMKQPDPVGDKRVLDPGQPGKEEEASSSSLEFMDEEAMLNMPNLLTEMAEGMLMSPPRMITPTQDDSPEDHEGDSLWSYK